MQEGSLGRTPYDAYRRITHGGGAPPVAASSWRAGVRGAAPAVRLAGADARCGGTTGEAGRPARVHLRMWDARVPPWRLSAHAEAGDPRWARGTCRPTPPRNSSACWSPGDVLLLYTDGVIEATDSSGEDLGTEGLAAMMARHAGPADALVAGLAADLKAAWRAADDVTLVAIGRP